MRCLEVQRKVEWEQLQSTALAVRTAVWSTTESFQKIFSSKLEPPDKQKKPQVSPDFFMRLEKMGRGGK